MFFKSKNKGYFVDRNEHAWLLAKCSSDTTPLVVERLVEVPVGDSQGLAVALEQLKSGGSSGNYLNAVCGIYPSKRMVRRATIDIKRTKEPTYLNEVCIQQFRIEPDKHSIAILSSQHGTLHDAAKVSEKELLFCGLPLEDLNSAQDDLLNCGVYPTRLELGSVSVLGAMSDYLAFAKTKNPALLLEIGNDTTHSYIVTANGVEASRPIPFGIEAMIPVVQKKLGLKDEESARKLFYSNTFDFTSMGAELVQRLLKELQSSIGFFEVQTGQSIAHLVCTMLPEKLGWIEASIATALGIAPLKMDLRSWLQSHQVSFSDQAGSVPLDVRWAGLMSLMVNYQTTAANGPANEKKD